MVEKIEGLENDKAILKEKVAALTDSNKDKDEKIDEGSRLLGQLVEALVEKNDLNKKLQAETVKSNDLEAEIKKSIKELENARFSTFISG